MPKFIYPNEFNKIHKSKRIQISFLFLLQTISLYSLYESLKFTSLSLSVTLNFSLEKVHSKNNKVYILVCASWSQRVYVMWLRVRKLRPKTVVVSVVVDDVGKNLERSHWHEINVSILSFNFYLAHPSYLLLPP